MNILHICNDYQGSKVHQNLYSSLVKYGLHQTIFVPYRRDKKRIEDLNNNFQIFYSRALKSRHRIFFSTKIKFLFRSIIEQIELSQINLIHATTLFSDGAVALKIYKKYRTPYIVTVRTTDVSIFLKFRPDLFFLLDEILENASQIIFVSKSLEKSFSGNYLVRKLKSDWYRKSCVIYNGIDNFWLRNINLKRSTRSFTNFVYVGNFSRNKNVVKLVKSFLHTNKNYTDSLKLNIVGCGGDDENNIRDLAIKHPQELNFIGRIDSKEELKKIFRENDCFIMISISETFGLVYIEALSQGLPIIYTEKQGVDGLFNKFIGVPVNSKSLKDITRGIREITKSSPKIALSESDFQIFDWDSISCQYYKLYELYYNQTI